MTDEISGRRIVVDPGKPEEFYGPSADIAVFQKPALDAVLAPLLGPPGRDYWYAEWARSIRGGPSMTRVVFSMSVDTAWIQAVFDSIPPTPDG